jgi:Xaa-Pro aminopeptidase
MNIEKRIRAIQNKIAERSLAGLILSRYPTIGYLTGVYQRWGTIMLVPRKGQPILCSAEIARVRDEASEPDLIEFVGQTGYKSAVYYSRINAVTHEIKRLHMERERLGCEKGSLSAGEYEDLKGLLPQAEWVNAGDLIPSLMLIKDPQELRVMRKLAAIADVGINEALQSLRVGANELEISGRMDLAMKQAGAEKTWFPTHVASGYRSNFNMAYPTDNIVQSGDKVALDVGPLLQLYCGQLNVHVMVGKSTPAHKKLFQAGAEVLETIYDALEPGKKASEMYDIGMQKARELGYGEVLPHFGRGIGMIDNEELLTFSPTCETVLSPGMVLAIITYIRDGLNVISNERMVEVTEKSCQWLCSYPLELIEI